jgi:hypothetical protein
MPIDHNHDELNPVDLNDAHSHNPVEIDASEGYEKSDVRITGIIVFVVALTIFVAATGALVFFIGKVINSANSSTYEKDYGKPTRWTKTVEVRDLGNLAANPKLQHRFGELTQQYPTPRLQQDQGDGADDIVSLHQREDLLLNHYSWADAAHTKVRIPISRAMELIAQQGLPVAPATAQAVPLTGEVTTVVTKPLTNGFAPTGYEQEVRSREAVEAQRLNVPNTSK